MGIESKSHRDFYRLASAAGLDHKKTREIALNPDTLLQKRSPELRNHIKLDDIISFFELITGKDGDIYKAEKIGKFLFDHRPDHAFNESGPRNIKKLPSKDHYLVRLANSILQESFYSGLMFNLDEQRLGMVVFITNMIAKQIGGAKISGKPYFDSKKLAAFVANVEQHAENEMLSPYDSNDTDPFPIRLEHAKKNINRELEELKLVPGTEWPQDNGASYIIDLADRLESVIPVMRNFLTNSPSIRTLEECVYALNNHAITVGTTYRKIALNPNETEEFPSVLDALLLDSDRISEPDSEHRNEIISLEKIRLVVKEVLAKLQILIETQPYPSKPSRQKHRNNYYAKQAQGELFNQLPLAIEILSELTAKSPGGSLREPLKVISKKAKLKDNLQKLETHVENWLLADSFVLKVLEEEQPNALAYLIKACLIAENDRRHTPENSQIGEKLTPDEQAKSYDFGDTDPSVKKNRMQVHSYPLEVYFAKEAVEYLHAKVMPARGN